MTSIREEDVIHTLKSLQLLKYRDIEIKVSLMPGMIDFHFNSRKFMKQRLIVEQSAIQWTQPNTQL